MSPSRVADALSFLFGAAKARPRGRRVLGALSLLLALTGAGMLSYPLVTHVYSNRVQSRLAREFSTPRLENAYEKKEVAPGQALIRIQIPRLGVDALVVEGTEPDELRAGAGHYSHTPLPCSVGNVAIAGHRTTYGKPFSRMDELVEGDEIVLVSPEHRCVYRVVDGPPGTPRPRPGAAPWITRPDDWSVVEPTSDASLTLTTCHPRGSDAKRLIVRAKMASDVQEGAAR